MTLENPSQANKDIKKEIIEEVVSFPFSSCTKVSRNQVAQARILAVQARKILIFFSLLPFLKKKRKKKKTVTPESQLTSTEVCKSLS